MDDFKSGKAQAVFRNDFQEKKKRMMNGWDSEGLLDESKELAAAC